MRTALLLSIAMTAATGVLITVLMFAYLGVE